MILATRTLDAIHNAIAADGGASFRVWQGKVLPHIGDAYSGDKEDDQRTHLGASVIGDECARKIFYGFRWVGKNIPTQAEKDARTRMLRLWNRGHLEEGRFIALLRCAGMRVVQQDKTGKQFRFRDYYGHYAGSIDGVLSNCPDSPDGSNGLVEFKTYNDKRFAQLVSNGVENSDWKYYVQVQQYMRKMGLTWTLFIAVNKNDETLHAEIVHLKEENALQYRDRAIGIVCATEAPPKLRNASPGFFKCKFCDFSQTCHLGKPADENCRTCTYSKPLPQMGEDGKGLWGCTRDVGPPVLLDKGAQQRGCEHYRVMKGL